MVGVFSALEPVFVMLGCGADAVGGAVVGAAADGHASKLQMQRAVEWNSLAAPSSAMFAATAFTVKPPIMLSHVAGGSAASVR